MPQLTETDDSTETQAGTAERTEPQPSADSGLFNIDLTNYAEDPDIAGRALRFCLEITQEARADRTAFNQEVIQLYNIWDVRRDVRYYTGRADLYLPAGHRAVERAVAKQTARLFPAGDDFIDVKPIPPGDESLPEVAENLDAAKALIWYDLHESVKLRQKFPMFLRQLNVAGTSVWATEYITSADMAGRRGRQRGVLGRMAAGTGFAPLGNRSPFIVGPTGRVVDVLTWYAWPPTADSVADAMGVFEDQLITLRTLKAWRDMERYYLPKTDEAIKAYAGQAPTNSVWSASRRLQQRGIGSQSEPKDGYVITVLYADWNPSDDPEAEPISFKFTLLADQLCIEARQNPWWDQEPPYEVARINRYVDEFYGRGLIYFIRKLQYQLNDTADQTFDAMSYVLNPVAAVDPMLVNDPSILIERPGAKWPVPPTAIKWREMPPVHRHGWEAIRQIWETISEVSGAATGGQYLPTLGVAKGADTATGQALLIQQGDIDVALVTSSIEEDVLEPLCHRLDSREQQFLPQHGERLLRAMGRKGLPLLRDGMRIRREQMLGTRTYMWTGGSISEQREKLQRVGPSLLTIASKIPASPKGRIEILELFRDIYRSYGFSNADDVIRIPEPGAGFDPDLEHLVMAAGHAISPRPGEPHTLHLAKHNAMLPQAKDQGWADRLAAHMFATMELLREEGQPQQGASMSMPPAPPGQGQPAGMSPLAQAMMMARERGMPGEGGMPQ